jgi:hypothetical protein
MTIEMTHLRYFDHQSRISGAGAKASLILFRFPSLVGDVDDSHNFEVEAFAFNVVAGEGSDCVEVDAIGRDSVKCRQRYGILALALHSFH